MANTFEHVGNVSLNEMLNHIHSDVQILLKVKFHFGDIKNSEAP